MSLVWPPGSIPLESNEEPPVLTVAEFWRCYGGVDGGAPQWPVCEQGACNMPGIVGVFENDQCWVFCFECAGRPHDPAYVEDASQWIDVDDDEDKGAA